jgi:hypothetical protein
MTMDRFMVFAILVLWLRSRANGLHRAIVPMSDVVMMAASSWARQRQQGRLTDYILYLVAGLAAVGVLVVFENM